MLPMRRIGIMSSGYERTFEYICQAIKTHELASVQISALIVSKPNVPIIEVAEKFGVPYVIAQTKIPREIDALGTKHFLEANIEVILLTGYKYKIGPELLEAYPGRILNLHPGPLPEFGGKGMYGKAVQQAVLASGAALTGPTVHIVDKLYDHGPILGYHPIPVSPDDTVDTLFERCAAVAPALYVATLIRFLKHLQDSKKGRSEPSFLC